MTGEAQQVKVYTFRDGKLKSPVLRVLNAVGQAAAVVGMKPSLDPDSIVEAAIKDAGSSDFGGDSYREPLERLIDSMEREANLSTFGRVVVRRMVTTQLVTRIRLQEWTKANPAAKDEEISQMKAKMEDMAREFGGMLKETLDKMRERIELSSTNLDVDVVPDGAAVEAYGV